MACSPLVRAVRFVNIFSVAVVATKSFLSVVAAAAAAAVAAAAGNSLATAGCLTTGGIMAGWAWVRPQLAPGAPTRPAPLKGPQPPGSGDDSSLQPVPIVKLCQFTCGRLTRSHVKRFQWPFTLGHV